MSRKELTGTFYGTTREDEEKKLKQVTRIAEEELKRIKKSADDLQEELNSLREVYDVDDKEGLAQWFNTDARFKVVRNDLRRAERSGKKPFFGRIDIEDEESNSRETFYIGKALIARKASEPEVIDWRAPISSVYYDHSLGKCSYTVPMEGIYNVDLKRKRTYEIEDGIIKDYYDSDVVANDDLLTRYLSKSKRNVLSEIIATIQQEQNEVIRKNPKHNVLIQGSAGSGKTTVAMHRISYILYNYETEFKPDGFYIVGSNKILLNYITGVLPDLDVYGVRQMTMEELFTRLLYEDWDRKKYKVRAFDKKEKSIGIKGTGEWFKRLRSFCKKVEWRHIPRENMLIEKNGHLLMSRSDIEKVLTEYPDWSMVRKFERLNDLIESKLETELFGKYYSYSEEEQKKLTRKYTNYFDRFIWKGSVFDLYEEFVNKELIDHPEIIYERNAPDLYDLASLAYIYKRIKESEVIQEASHVVIDEAQDFGISIYYSLKYCMSKCTFTIMGDVSQNIYFDCGLQDWEELKKVMLPDRYDYFGLLRKSYRNTVEISNFATDILKRATFPIYPVEPVIRHGDDVICEKASDPVSLKEAVLQCIRSMREKQYETIAVICRDMQEVADVYDFMHKQTDIKVFSGEDTDFSKGVYVIPIEYSKGLEFDAVIIYDASDEAYPKEDGYARLLYVAATRALHELKVFYLNNPTGLIADPVPKERENISFSEDTYHLKPRVFEEEFKSKGEIAEEQARKGNEERRLRERYGPKKIVVNNDSLSGEKAISHRAVAKVSGTVPLSSGNTDTGSSDDKTPGSEFGSMPADTSLKPIGHAKIDNAIRWINKSKDRVEAVTRYGNLTVIPVAGETVRILFSKDDIKSMQSLPDEVKHNPSVKWIGSDTRDAVEIKLEKLTVRIDKKTGAVSFISKKGDILLSENPVTARQYHGNANIWWEYFDWSKKENLSARSDNDSVWEDITNTAKYISHTAVSQKPSMIMSAKGYQILVPGSVKVLACTLPAYGPYLRFEETSCIDYIFRAAR